MHHRVLVRKPLKTAWLNVAMRPQLSSKAFRPNPETLRAWLVAACRASPVLISRAAQPTFGRVLARMKASAALL